MLQLLRAAAATLLLLQLVTVEGLINTTGCEQTKACWTTEDCIKEENQNQDRMMATQKSFYLRDKKADIDGIEPGCQKYFIVEPGTEDFVFEIMHKEIDEDKSVTLGFNGVDGANGGETFTCDKRGVKIGKREDLFVATMEQHAEAGTFYCRFKVAEKAKNTQEEFWSTFVQAFQPKKAWLKYDGVKIEIDDYNSEHFKGRVPCKNVFLTEKVSEKEYHKLPTLNVGSRLYECDPDYAMSYNLFKENKPEQGFKNTVKKVKCELGKVSEEGVTKDGTKVASAKCWRYRNTLCDNVCSNSTACAEQKIDMKDVKGVKVVACRTTKFMIVNDHIHTINGGKCSDQSTPSEHLWDSEETGKFKDVIIDSVKCVEELDCNEIAPFGEAKCENCSKVSAEGTCPAGSRLVWIDESGIHHYATISCNKGTGNWQMEWDGKRQPTKNREETSKIELTCFGPKPKDPEKPAPAAAATNIPLYLGGGLGALLLLLLIILLLYWFCCRKKPVVKEESRKEKAPLAPPPQPPSMPEPSVVEDLPPAPPVAIASSESDQPVQYSGQRVQFINVTKEHLREIEPTVDDDRYKEYSARDMSDSERSKGSQMSQVGTGATFTGTRGATEQTNEVSRTLAAADESRSEVSRSNGGSQVATIGGAAAAADADKKKRREGPRVEFRERVSYETETRTRDRSSNASMHTAPEQPAPVVDRTQPEASKDDPSRLGADSARKAFGAPQRTRTTQNTNATSDGSVVGNRSDSRVTDISRTG